MCSNRNLWQTCADWLLKLSEHPRFSDCSLREWRLTNLALFLCCWRALFLLSSHHASSLVRFGFEDDLLVVAVGELCPSTISSDVARNLQRYGMYE